MLAESNGYQEALVEKLTKRVLSPTKPCPHHCFILDTCKPLQTGWVQGSFKVGKILLLSSKGKAAYRRAQEIS